MVQPNAIKAGLCVEFMHENIPTLGYVVEEQGGKLRLLLANRREMNLTIARVLPWIGPHLQGKSKEEIISALQVHKEERKKIQERVNINELWQMTQGEVIEEEIEFFASLMESEINSDILAGYAHALLENKSYFKFQNPCFEVFTEETVNAKLEAERTQKERTALISGGAEWFKYLWDLYCKNHYVQEKDLEKQPQEPVCSTLKQLLMTKMADQESHEEDLLWKQVTKQIPDDAFMAYMLAVTWKIVPEHYNFWLSKAQYDSTQAFADPFSHEIQKIQNLAEIIKSLGKQEYNCSKDFIYKEEAHKNALQATLEDKEIFCSAFAHFSEKKYISIDSESTKDIDDAFSFNILENGDQELVVALACPAFFWQFQSNFDKCIAKRSTSIYLPEGSLHMLPESLSTSCYSLIENEIKPAMLVRALYDSEGNLKESSLNFARVIIQDNLQYSACEQVLSKCIVEEQITDSMSMEDLLNNMEEKSYYECNYEKYAPSEQAIEKAQQYSDILEKTYYFAKKHLQQRIENGAVILERDEYDLFLEGEGKDTKVHIEAMPQNTKAQLIVAEAMVIANSIAADFAVENGLNLFFRTQNVGIPKEKAGVWRKPEEIAKVARLLSTALVEIEAKPHTGLGLKAYSPITSPLRRYADLINQAQIMHFYFFQKALWTKEELDSMLTQFNVYNGLANQVQRNRPRYWRFVFMQQEAKRNGEACSFHGIISDENDMYVTVTLTREQILVRGKKSLFGEKALLGQEVLLRLGKINPLQYEVSIMKVQEI